MPIRINLLAEAQALEQMRRRDPVKRVIYVGICLALAILAYSSQLQLSAMLKKSVASRLESQLSTQTNDFREVTENQRKLTDVSHKLTSLNQLAANRLLHGTLLNALQQATVDDVQLIRYKTEQLYTLNEAVKPKTNANKKITLGRPATVTEQIVVSLEAKDTCVNPGDQVNKFKQAVADCPYFQSVLGKTNEVRLAQLSPPTAGGQGGKPFVTFTVECRFPEKTR